MSSFSFGLLLSLTVFNTLNSQLAQRRVVTAPGEFRAVPNQKLLALLKWFDGVEVDVQTVLARHKVLLLHSTGWVDVAHPVAPLLIQTIQDVVQMPLTEDPPEVLSVSIFRQCFIGVAFPHQRAKTCPHGNQLFTGHPKYLCRVVAAFQGQVSG